MRPQASLLEDSEVSCHYSAFLTFISPTSAHACFPRAGEHGPSAQPHYKGALSEGGLSAKVYLGTRTIPVWRGLLKGGLQLPLDIRRQGGDGCDDMCLQSQHWEAETGGLFQV